MMFGPGTRDRFVDKLLRRWVSGSASQDPDSSRMTPTRAIAPARKSLRVRVVRGPAAACTRTEQRQPLEVFLPSVFGSSGPVVVVEFAGRVDELFEAVKRCFSRGCGSPSSIWGPRPRRVRRDAGAEDSLCWRQSLLGSVVVRHGFLRTKRVCGGEGGHRGQRD